MGPDRGATTGIARWQKVVGVIGLVVVLGLGILMFGRGDYRGFGMGPGMHTPGSNRTGGTTASGQVTANVSYLLYDGELQQARIRQAQAQAESARQNLAATRAPMSRSRRSAPSWM